MSSWITRKRCAALELGNLDGDPTMKSRHDEIATISAGWREFGADDMTKSATCWRPRKRLPSGGTFIRRYSWAASAAAATAVLWMAITRAMTTARRQYKGTETSVDGKPSSDSQEIDSKPARFRSAFLDLLANVLAGLAVRAARNYATCCFIVRPSPLQALRDRPADDHDASNDSTQPDCRDGWLLTDRCKLQHSLVSEHSKT